MIYRGPGFSRRRMIWLLPHHLPLPFPVSKLDRRHTGRLKDKQLADGRGGGGWGWSQIMRRDENLVLSIIFNTLWLNQLKLSVLTPKSPREGCQVETSRGYNSRQTQADRLSLPPPPGHSPCLDAKV
jgi:hypothetical protein